MRQLLFWCLLDKNRTECSVWYIFPLGCIIEKIILNKGEYIMGTEKNNNNNEDRIFEISSKQRPEIENQSRLEDEEVTKNKKEW